MSIEGDRYSDNKLISDTIYPVSDGEKCCGNKMKVSEEDKKVGVGER